MNEATRSATSPPFNEIVEQLVSAVPPSLPFSQTATITPTQISVDRRPYSTVLHLRLAAGDDEWFGYVKVSDPERISTEFRLLERVRVLFEDASPSIGVVRPVAHFPEYSALVTEAVPGNDLGAELKARAALPTRALPQDLQRACHQAGQWLRHFQSVTSEPDGVFSLVEMRAYTDERLAALEARGFLGFSAADRRRTLATVDAWADDVPDQDLAVGAVHGDYSPGNLVVSRGRVVVLDFPTRAPGSIFHDLVHLCHHFRSLTHHPRYSKQVVAALDEALLEGFGDVGLARRPIFRLFEVQHTVCMLAESLKEHRRSSRAARLLERYTQRRRLGVLRRLSRSTPAADGEDE